MNRITFDPCTFKFYYDDDEILSMELAKKIIFRRGQHGNFTTGESAEGTPVFIWELKPENRLFLFIDKTGRGITSNLTKEQVMQWDDFEDTHRDDLNDQTAQEFAQESDIGDIWETRTIKLIRIE